VLRKVRDLGMPLLSVTCVENDMERRNGIMNRKEKMSLLWIVVMLNMAFADILTFILPGSLQEIMTGDMGGLRPTQAMLLAFAALIEIPIVMIVLSRMVKRQINRILNIIASIITIAFVVGGGSATLHYIFFAGMEVACMVLIILMCVTWRKDQGESNGK
jgi:uncharacterized membrane protein YhaH (DUF805 family)